MENTTLLSISLFIFFYSLFSKRVQSIFFTPQIVFTLFGFISGLLGIINFNAEKGIIKFIAELTLILVLFTNASNLNFKKITLDIPFRLLSIGMPLMIIFGTLITLIFFNNLSIWEAAVLATVLTPTDADLSKGIINNKDVPNDIRQSLNIESGLNDGIALQFLLVFLAISSACQGHFTPEYWVIFLVKQIVLGIVIGALTGLIGGKLIEQSNKSENIVSGLHYITGLSSALVSFSLAESFGGNGFISVFFAGLVIGNLKKVYSGNLKSFTEAEGHLTEIVTFIIFGNIMLNHTIQHININMILYAILSLTIIRILPVLISLINTNLDLTSKLFFGWFGPRGIASILFSLLVLEKVELNNRHEIYCIAVTTIVLSILLHGLSATPLSKIYIKSAKT